MTLDQRLTRAARRLADGLTPPAVDLDEIRGRARRTRTSKISVGAGATLAVVVAVAVTLAGRDATSPEPVGPTPTPSQDATVPPASEEPNPFPKKMTPEQVVLEPGAQLRTVAVAPGDPDVRLSLWSFTCTRPCPEEGPFEFSGAALTTDGFATTTYLRPPFTLGVDLQVTSPRDGLFLVSDQSNGGEWLIDVMGSVRSVTRVRQEIVPADPRLWFQCVGRWRSTWCSLDLDTATAYKWPQAWDGSAVSPAGGDRPWGANPEPRATSSSGLLEAWWDTDQGRELRTLAETHQGDYILDSPAGSMSYWARPDGADVIDIYTSRNRGADWEVDSREAPGVEAGIGGFMQIRRSPDGAFLASSTFPRLMVWRAETAGGAFRKVYEESGSVSPETTGAGLWSSAEGLVYATANARVAISDDDGRTWATVETWR